MGFFKKKNKQEIVDFSLMQKRGLLNREDIRQKETINLGISNNKTEVVDDFLSNLAGASSSSSGPITESLREARKRNNTNAEINELRLKLDDNDFKLKSLIERIKELERRIDERGI